MSETRFGFLIGRGVIASRPAAGTLGALYISTDETGSPKWYRDNSSSWDNVTPPSGSGSSFSWVAKTANYTITTSDSGILGDATSAPITITLPTAVGISQMFAIKKKDSSANTVTIATTSAQTIDGASTRVLSTQYDGVIVWSDGANWFVAAIPFAASGGGALTTVSSYLSADVTISTNNTYFDGPSVSCTSGKWLLIGAVDVQVPGGNDNFMTKLWDGTTNISSGQVQTDAASAHLVVPMHAIVSPGSTTTYKISVTTQSVTTGLIKAAMTLDAAGNTASYLLGVKIG